MVQKRLFRRQIGIYLFVVGLTIGFGWQTGTADARVSLTDLQNQINDLQDQINNIQLTPGPQGPQGPPGPVNAISTSCPSGQAVVGMDMSGNFLCESFSQDSSGGTVGMDDGSISPVTYVLCGTGAPGQCTAQTAKDSCTNIGQRVVSHASNGTSEVASLGATTSGAWCVSYYKVNYTMPPASCLVGISNLEWSNVCGTSAWHGNTIAFGAPGQGFGYVDPSWCSGYDSSYPNMSGQTWGCQSTDSAAQNLSGCTEQYVACTP